jgi:hypothetical protein
MEVIVVLFRISQLLLKLNLPKPSRHFLLARLHSAGSAHGSTYAHSYGEQAVSLCTLSVSWSLSCVTYFRRCWAAFLAAVTSANSAINLSTSVGLGRGSRGAS